MKFTKQNLEEIRAALNNALAPVKTKYKLASVHLGTIRFSENEFTVKLSVKAELVPTTNFTRPEDELIGKEFNLNGEVFKIVDYNSRRWKRPVIAENENGRRFCFSDNVTKQLLS